VRVTVTSSLTLEVGAKGAIESARFAPPLMPEIQTCAAAAIYAIPFEGESGTVVVPIEFSY
jgi:hypothetical protein